MVKFNQIYWYLPCEELLFMITGTLKDLSVLSKLGGNFTAVVDFLKKLDVTALKPGKYEIDGDKAYAFFSEMTLRDPSELPFEAHARYADIQMIIDGLEEMWQAPVSDALPVRTPFDESKDAAFYNDPDHFNTVVLGAGEFAVFFPEDAHKPCCMVKDSKHSLKLLFKVRVAD